MQIKSRKIIINGRIRAVRVRYYLPASRSIRSQRRSLQRPDGPRRRIPERSGSMESAPAAAVLPFRQHFYTLFSEQVITVFGQFGRSEPGHVFDESQDGDVDFVVSEHRDAADDVRQRHFLRRADDNGSRYRHFGDDRQVYVAGSGRQVDQQEIERSPTAFGGSFAATRWSPSGRATSARRPGR